MSDKVELILQGAHFAPMEQALIEQFGKTETVELNGAIRNRLRRLLAAHEGDDPALQEECSNYILPSIAVYQSLRQKLGSNEALDVFRKFYFQAAEKGAERLHHKVDEDESFLIKLVHGTGTGLYKLFRFGNWSFVLYSTFVHAGICMLPVVFNAGVEITGDSAAAIGMAIRVAKSIAVPLFAAFLAMDMLTSVAWMGLVAKKKLPVSKWLILCNPLCFTLLGQLIEPLPWPWIGMDSGFESLGWLSMYLACALCLVKKEERCG